MDNTLPDSCNNANNWLAAPVEVAWPVAAAAVAAEYKSAVRIRNHRHSHNSPGSNPHNSPGSNPNNLDRSPRNNPGRNPSLIPIQIYRVHSRSMDNPSPSHRPSPNHHGPSRHGPSRRHALPSHRRDPRHREPMPNRSKSGPAEKA